MPVRLGDEYLQRDSAIEGRRKLPTPSCIESPSLPPYLSRGMLDQIARLRWHPVRMKKRQGVDEDRGTMPRCNLRQGGQCDRAGRWHKSHHLG
jgi:hypothetical protein